MPFIWSSTAGPSSATGSGRKRSLDEAAAAPAAVAGPDYEFGGEDEDPEPAQEGQPAAAEEAGQKKRRRLAPNKAAVDADEAGLRGSRIFRESGNSRAGAAKLPYDARRIGKLPAHIEAATRNIHGDPSFRPFVQAMNNNGNPKFNFGGKR